MKMEQWEKNNIFRSFLADDLFRYDVLEKIANDYKENMKYRNKKVTREDMEDALYEVVENISHEIEYFLDEEFEEEDDE
jgi:hypothetical protein